VLVKMNEKRILHDECSGSRDSHYWVKK